jgi:3D (Asp-Asp-Asp) domain-containing protein
MPKNNILQRTALSLCIALSLGGSLMARQDGASIKPATVTLVEGGKSSRVITHETTVEGLLKEREITLGKTDTLSLPATSRVLDGMTIELTRAPKVKPSPKPAPTTNPTPAPVRKSVRRASKLASRSTVPSSGVRTYSMVATAYSNLGNGPWGNKTATGAICRRGIVAVDPRVIRLGTRLWVEGYGECIALDTGGAIKGMRIDLFMPRESECNRWGRRRVKVVVLGR